MTTGTAMIASEFAALQKKLRGSGCFAFRKGDYFFLYREVVPKNVLAVKSKSFDEFKAKAAVASGVVL
jgi:hypothetical protein